VEKYGIDEQATDDYSVLRMCCVWSITKGADTHTNTIHSSFISIQP